MWWIRPCYKFLIVPQNGGPIDQTLLVPVPPQDAHPELILQNRKRRKLTQHLRAVVEHVNGHLKSYFGLLDALVDRRFSIDMVKRIVETSLALYSWGFRTQPFRKERFASFPHGEWALYSNAALLEAAED
jgi:hypothetical protein